MNQFNAFDLIQKKKRGQNHSEDEVRWLINSFTKNLIPDYQMSAWAMAVYFQGLTNEEISWLTGAMRDSGEVLDFSHLHAPRLDKHSTGGVGDKTSIIIGPIMAAAEVYTPMIAGRGLAHTGGTLDKLESLPGFRVNWSEAEFSQLVENNYFAIMGQTQGICPADKKLYALRDVTATVDSIALICGSIMSKKLAEGLTGLVLDVKFGSGAFMKTLEAAEELAALLKSVGEHQGLQVHAVLSNMNEPLGRFSGNACEIRECADILRGQKFEDGGLDWYEPTKRLSLILAGHMLFLAKKAKSAEEGLRLAENLVASGKAWKAFEALLENQGPCRISDLPEPKFSHTVTSPKQGCIVKVDTEKLGRAAVALGVGRKTSSDIVDPAAGIEHLSQPGMNIELGQPLYRIFSSHENGIEPAQKLILDAVEISESLDGQNYLPLIGKVLE